MNVFTAPKKTKYHAKATEVNGVRFPSKREAGRWQELKLLERAGEIRNLRRQVIIKLQGQHGPILTKSGKPMKLTVDFAYEDSRAGWALVYEESKGMRTRDYDVRLAVVNAMGIEIKHS